MFYGFKKESFTIVENTSLLKYDYSPATLKLNKGSPAPFYSNQFWQTVDEAFQILIAAFFFELLWAF